MLFSSFVLAIKPNLWEPVDVSRNALYVYNPVTSFFGRVSSVTAYKYVEIRGCISSKGESSEVVLIALHFILELLPANVKMGQERKLRQHCVVSLLVQSIPVKNTASGVI